MSGSKLTFYGDRKMIETMKDLDRRIGSKASKRGLGRFAEVVVNTARLLCGRRRSGNLQKSIDWKFLKPRKGRNAAMVGVVHDALTYTHPRSGKVDPEDPGNIAHLVEFGTVERHPGGVMPADPFMRPAIDSTQSVGLTIIGDELEKEIAKTPEAR